MAVLISDNPNPFKSTCNIFIFSSFLEIKKRENHIYPNHTIFINNEQYRHLSHFTVLYESE